MKPIDFMHKNCVFAANQPEYLPLPAHKSADGPVQLCGRWRNPDGRVPRWYLAKVEREMARR